MSHQKTDPKEIERELLAAIADDEYLRRENERALREPPPKSRYAVTSRKR